MKEKFKLYLLTHKTLATFAVISLLTILGGLACYFGLVYILSVAKSVSLYISLACMACFAIPACIFNRTAIKLLIKHQEIVKYGIFGVLTTLVNYAFYILFTRAFAMHELWATGIAFMLSIIFAYFTNRIWVFNSKVKGKDQALEFCKFFFARSSGFFIDLGIMWLFVTTLCYNDLIIKLASNIFIIILNFVISKLFVFNKK